MEDSTPAEAIISCSDSSLRKRMTARPNRQAPISLLDASMMVGGGGPGGGEGRQGLGRQNRFQAVRKTQKAIKFKHVFLLLTEKSLKTV
jgi:hypothetical protein